MGKNCLMSADLNRKNQLIDELLSIASVPASDTYLARRSLDRQSEDALEQRVLRTKASIWIAEYSCAFPGRSISIEELKSRAPLELSEIIDKLVDDQRGRRILRRRNKFGVRLKRSDEWILVEAKADDVGAFDVNVSSNSVSRDLSIYGFTQPIFGVGFGELIFTDGNGCYRQVALEDNGSKKIRYFVPVDPLSLEPPLKTPHIKAASVSVGDDALFCFIDDEQKVLVGTRMNLMPKLRLWLLVSEGAPVLLRYAVAKFTRSEYEYLSDILAVIQAKKNELGISDVWLKTEHDFVRTLGRRNDVITPSEVRSEFESNETLMERIERTTKGDIGWYRQYAEKARTALFYLGDKDPRRRMASVRDLFGIAAKVETNVTLPTDPLRQLVRQSYAETVARRLIEFSVPDIVPGCKSIRKSLWSDFQKRYVVSDARAKYLLGGSESFFRDLLSILSLIPFKERYVKSIQLAEVVDWRRRIVRSGEKDYLLSKGLEPGLFRGFSPEPGTKLFIAFGDKVISGCGEELVHAAIEILFPDLSKGYKGVRRKKESAIESIYCGGSKSVFVLFCEPKRASAVLQGQGMLFRLLTVALGYRRGVIIPAHFSDTKESREFNIRSFWKNIWGDIVVEEITVDRVTISNQAWKGMPAEDFFNFTNPSFALTAFSMFRRIFGSEYRLKINNDAGLSTEEILTTLTGMRKQQELAGEDEIGVRYLMGAYF